MNRRQLLHALSVGALTAGCLGAPEEQSPTDSRTSEPSTTTPTATTESPRTRRDSTPTETTTATPSDQTVRKQKTAVDGQVCLDEGETRLKIGESYEFGEWIVTPTSVELTTTYRLDDTRKLYEVRGDTQLAIAEVQLEVAGDQHFSWTAGKLQFVRSPCTAEAPVQAFEHPEQDVVYLFQLQRVAHDSQWDAQGHRVRPDQIGRVWTVSFVPESVTRSQIELGLGWKPEHQLPVRWVPE